MTDSDLARLLAIQDGFILGRALHVVAEFGVADLLADGPRTADDLAAATATDPDALYRFLRALSGCDVFTEVTPRCFALTAVGQYLRSDHPRSVRTYLGWGDVVSRAFQDAAHSLRTGGAAFDKAFGESFFGYLRGHPDQAAIFDTGMAELSAGEDAAVIAAYDFAGTRSIVDVGGGTGSLLRAVLAAHPGTTGLLFDQAPAAETARGLTTEAGLADRCTVEAGDFFEHVPPGGAVYLLKSVIHDWPDPQAIEILAVCRRAMGRDSRLLLVERVIPAGDAPHPSKPMDVAMLILLGGRERTEDDYAALLSAAGFRITRVVPTASAVTVVEAVPDVAGQGVTDSRTGRVRNPRIRVLSR